MMDMGGNPVGEMPAFPPRVEQSNWLLPVSQEARWNGSRCGANIFPSRKSFHLTSLRLREAIFTPPSRWLRFWASLLRKFFRLLRLLASVEVFTLLSDMSFYDHLSFYLDNGVYHPGTGDSNRKRNIRIAAKKYFTKGLLLC